MDGFEALPLPLYLASQDGRLVAANAALLELIGCERDRDVANVDLGALHVRRQQWRTLRAHLSRGETPYRMEADLRCLDGRLIRVEHRAWAVPLAQGGEDFVAGALYDITVRRRREARNLHRALHDPLTALPNRRLLLDRLRHALARHDAEGASCTLLFLDLDGFKRVNDTLGHLAGDALLRAVAGRLQACVRRNETVARMSGDEFCVLVDAPHAVAVRMAERIRAAIARPFVIGSERAELTGSIGIAIVSGPRGAPEDVLRRADRAMYRAKAAGGDRIVEDDLPADAGDTGGEGHDRHAGVDR